jgi:pimeloyl-ACP methyl ester carboxylesterase
VAAPTLLLAGERSPGVLRRLSDRLQELLPNVERTEIAAASHRMHKENPAAVNDAISAFLDHHASRTSRGAA